MHRTLLTLFLTLILTAVHAAGSGFEQIRRTLVKNSSAAVQEKVFMHLDNTCYFVGDTLWYKAYLLRADNLHFSDMSRILYVELLAPDGLVVERQQVIVSDKGFGNGCFVLTDSLYSGYYELRAYTRWMLNFNVSHHRYTREDRHSFYNNAMARDFFRQWDGLYSRVVPVYSKPDRPGDFSYKRMYQRPKQSAIKAAPEKLNAVFFPEGGRLVKGLTSRVAFELTDQDGRAVDASGQLGNAEVKTDYMGRGVFTLTPGDKPQALSVTWHGKTYTFNLPGADDNGAVMHLADGRIDIATRNHAPGTRYGVSILCRGVLKHFEEVEPDAGGKVTIPVPPLPTGVNDVTLFDENGRILADRLFFVNNHDYDGGVLKTDVPATTTYKPYEKVSLHLTGDSLDRQTLVSVAVRDTRTDEPSYADGNIMTDMLLGGELKGFVAHPAYYFESDDAARRHALDLLMMVQGWRKYKWHELADSSYVRKRYAPETTLTVEGGVYKMLSVNEVEPDEIAGWATGKGFARSTITAEKDEASDIAADATIGETDGTITTDDIAADADNGDQTDSPLEWGNINDANADLGINHGGLKKEVVVEAELIKGGQVAGLRQKTRNGGRYMFEVPPFYGAAVLNMKAYNEKDTVAKNMESGNDRNLLDEDAYPDFYVKRDLFFPRFPHKYSYYQNHAPETGDYAGVPESRLSMENDDHLLQNVDVKGRRRGRRGIDYTKPAYVGDVYELYNDLTDYGLSIGKFDMRLFPVRVCQLLYGNMGRSITFNVDARINGKIFYRNYTPDTKNMGIMWDNFNPRALYATLKLKRLDKVRIFSDYEPRNEDADVAASRLRADATVELVPIADDGVQPTMRDRHIVLQGFNEPVEFYSPDYSSRKPDGQADYRRTLYWNPNVRTDADGNLDITFFTGSKDTRVKVSVAGVTAGGKFIRTK